MQNFIGSTWWLIVTLGLLVTFHEYGHFWVARRCGVRVLRFSVGFGRAIWSRTAKSGTEYRIGIIPLGGYVKMLDAREGDVPTEFAGQEFTSQSIWKRIAIVAAGPGFNLIFAIAAFWLMFIVGRPGIAPIIAPPAAQTLAQEAGFKAHDTITAINGKSTPTWDSALDELSEAALAHQHTHVTVKREQGSIVELALALDTLPRKMDLAQAFERIGLLSAPPAPLVAELTPDMPAARAGLREGDVILAINDSAVDDFRQIGTLIKTYAQPSTALDFHIARGSTTRHVSITPERVDPGDKGGERWIIGIKPPMPETTMVRYGALSALGMAVRTTWDKTATTFIMVWEMITGNVSTKNLSGIITIAQVANNSAQMGLAWFLSFLGLVSLSLAVLNLLPIPVLDGGHLLYYLIELVKGSPVSEGTMIVGQSIGLALITALMGLALYNDILRLIS